MFILKILAKIIVLPIILVLSIVLAIYGTIDKILGLCVGAVNIIYVIGVIAAVINTDSFYYVKQALIFFTLETILFGVPQLCAAGIKKLNYKLLDFVWA